jgi:hypothetical protein
LSGKVEFLAHRVPVEADGIAHSAHHHFGAAAIKVDAAQLPVGLRRLANVARRADIDVELVVRSQAHELPAVRLVVEKIAVDHDGLRRIVEVVLDVLQLGDASAFGDIERAPVEDEAVGPVHARGDHFHLAFAVTVDDCVDLVEQAVADEYGPLVANPQRTCIRDTARIDFDVETLGQLQLRSRQLVRRRPERQWCDVRQLLGDLGIGNVRAARHGGRHRLHGRNRFRCLGRGCRLCVNRRYGKQSGQQAARQSRVTWGHGKSSW